VERSRGRFGSHNIPSWGEVIQVLCSIQLESVLEARDLPSLIYYLTKLAILPYGVVLNSIRNYCSNRLRTCSPVLTFNICNTRHRLTVSPTFGWSISGAILMVKEPHELPNNLYQVAYSVLNLWRCLGLFASMQRKRAGGSNEGAGGA
jgi:hypothetical protein